MCLTNGGCLQSLTPGVSPQACAGGEEESEEGGGSTAAHLLEALRQFRLHHRGQYRSVLEESLAAYQLRGESAAGESRRTADDDDGGDDGDGKDGQEQPASPPSPPSPPPSPATAEPEASQDAPAPKSDPSD